MQTINRLREFLAEVNIEIPQIKFTQLIITKDEFIKFLKEREQSDNTMLFAVIPDHGLTGTEDNSKFNNSLQFYLLDKITEKDLTYDEKIDVYSKIQRTALNFAKYILNKKSGEGACGMFANLIESSFIMLPVGDLFDCRGYEIYFETYSLY